MQDIFQHARILVVDDEPSNVLLLEQMLEDWGYYHVITTTNPHEALSLYGNFDPHVVLLDLMMPELDGFAIMQQLRTLAPLEKRSSVLVLTADTSLETKRRALETGAQDFVTKPFDETEVSLRLRNLLEVIFLHQQLRHQNQELEVRVAERSEQLALSEHETAVCLGIAGEFRDDDTGRHTQRVGATATVLARESGLFDGGLHLILQAAPLHDVGKIGIPDSILLKPGQLTAEEFEIMKAHCVIGQGILSRHHTPLLQLAANIALSHHERFDGSGYPRGLAGEQIPLEGRIVTIVDVFDALTHVRPYKDAWPVERAVAEIQAQAGRQFDPYLVDVFTRSLNQILLSRQEAGLLGKDENYSFWRD